MYATTLPVDSLDFEVEKLQFLKLKDSWAWLKRNGKIFSLCFSFDLVFDELVPFLFKIEFPFFKTLIVLFLSVELDVCGSSDLQFRHWLTNLGSSKL